MVAEGELRSNIDDSDRVRELQDKVVDLKAEVSIIFHTKYTCFSSHPRNNHDIMTIFIHTTTRL